MQITGEHKNVQNALFQVTCKLRENLLPTKMLNGLRAGSPYRRAGESTMLHQSAGSVSRRMSRFQSGNRFGRKSGSSTWSSFTKLAARGRFSLPLFAVLYVVQPKRFVVMWSWKLHSGRTTYSTDNESSSTSSGKVSELERVPREVLNQARGSSGGGVLDGDHLSWISWLCSRRNFNTLGNEILAV